MSKHYETKQVILMRRSGKLMAQAAHASMMWLSKIVRAQLASEDGLEYAEDSRPLASLITNEQRAWTDGSFAKIVLAVGSEDELVSLIAEAKGRESWEVDALPPDELQRIIREAFEEEIDEEAMDEVKAKEEKGKDALREAAKEIDDGGE